MVLRLRPGPRLLCEVVFMFQEPLMDLVRRVGRLRGQRPPRPSASMLVTSTRAQGPAPPATPVTGSAGWGSLLSPQYGPHPGAHLVTPPVLSTAGAAPQRCYSSGETSVPGVSAPLLQASLDPSRRDRERRSQHRAGAWAARRAALGSPAGGQARRQRVESGQGPPKRKVGA